jgi:YggT family protein
MTSGVLIVTFTDLFVWIFTALLLARIIMSYIVRPTNRLYQVIIDVTEPLLSPLRRVLPRVPGMDFSPLALFFLLQAVQIAVHSLIQA